MFKIVLNNQNNFQNSMLSPKPTTTPRKIITMRRRVAAPSKPCLLSLGRVPACFTPPSREQESELARD
eukprot:1633286-Pleurochrysis_carterae.AAC.5